MKKKIIILILLILTGMWIILPQDGWCRMRPRPYDPWEPTSYLKSMPATDSCIHNSINGIDTAAESSGFDAYIFDTRTNLQRGEKSLNRFQKNVQNPGQVNK